MAEASPDLEWLEYMAANREGDEISRLDGGEVRTFRVTVEEVDN